MTHSVTSMRAVRVAASILQVGAVDDLYSTRDKFSAQPLVLRRIDRAAQIPDECNAKAFLRGVLGAPSHAKIARKATHENLAHAMLLQIAAESGRRSLAARIPVVADSAI